MNLLVTFLVYSIALTAQAEKKSPKPPSEDVADRWRKAGFKVGWFKDPAGSNYFSPAESWSEPPKPGDIVGFRFDAKKAALRNLPDPKAPFGLEVAYAKIPPKFFFSNLPQLEMLESLVLIACKFDDEALKPIPNMKSLHHLVLGSSTLGAEGIRTVSRSKTIRTISFSACEGVLNGRIKPIGEMRSLQRLGLDHCKKLSDPAMETVGKLTNLRELKLNHIPGITDEGIKSLSALQKLEDLELSATQVSDASAVVFASLPRLRKLGLSDCVEIGDATFQALEKSESLKELNIGQLPVSAASVASISKIKNLRRLYAPKSGINDAGLKLLGLNPNVAELILDDCRISDVGLRRLYGLKKLRWISLIRCEGVTEAGVQPLLELPELELISLYKCPSISKEFADAALKKTRERMRQRKARQERDDDET